MSANMNAIKVKNTAIHTARKQNARRNTIKNAVNNAMKNQYYSNIKSFFNYKTALSVIVGITSSYQANADDFLDTWVTFAFEDPHILANSEDGFPKAGFYEDDRASTFFDTYDSQYSGRETLSHLVLYKRMPGFITGFDAEASLVAKFSLYHDSETGKPFTKLGDDGSYIKVSYYPKSSRDKRVGNGISLTAFPFDSDRFKLGYSYDLSWGGKRTFAGNLDTIPALKLEYNHQIKDVLKSNIFVGAKNARLLNDAINEQETYYGVLGGLGLDIKNRLRFDIQGGYFQKGAYPPKGQTGPDGHDLLAGNTLTAFGVSARLGYHAGTPIGRSADFKLYKRDQYALIEDLRPERYDAFFSYALESEFSYLGQTLIDPDALGVTVVQPAIATDFNSKIKIGLFRAHFDAVYKSLSFILFNVPGMSPYYDFPENSKYTNEFYWTVGGDFHIPKAHITPGLTIGYQIPATYQGLVPEMDYATSGTTTIVAKDEGVFEILPPGQNKYDIMTVKTSCKWEISDFVTMLGEISYTLDKNQTKYVKDTEGSGTSQRIFDDPDVYNKLSASIFLQARF